MKRFASHILFTLLVAVLPAASAVQQLPLNIDAQQWSLVLGTAITEGDGQSLDAAQRRLLRDLQPLIDSQNYQGAADLFAVNPASDDWRLLRLQGQVLLAIGRYDEAQEVFERVLARQSDDAVTLQNMVTLHLQQERLSEAREYLVRSLSAGVQNAQIFGQLGYINLITASPHSAIHAYQSALMYEPEQRQWLQGLLYALVQSRATEQAWFVLEQLLKSDRGNPQLWLQRAQLALDSERKTSAIASLEAAFELGYNDVQVLLQAARMHLEFGSPQRAIELLASVPAGTLTNQEFFKQLEQVSFGLVKHQRWSLLQQLIETAATDTLNLTQRASLDYFRAELALARDNNIEAKQLLEKAEQRDPNHGHVLLRLAELYKAQGRQVRAELKLQRAVALPGVSQQARMNLAQLAIEQRDYEKALVQLRELYREEPNQPNLLQNIRMLERQISN